MLTGTNAEQETKLCDELSHISNVQALRLCIAPSLKLVKHAGRFQ